MAGSSSPWRPGFRSARRSRHFLWPRQTTPWNASGWGKSREHLCWRRSGRSGPDLAQVDGVETELECRGAGLEAEIVLLGRGKERVGDDGIAVVIALAPLLERTGAHGQRLGLGAVPGIEIEIPVYDIAVARPIAAQEGAGIKIDDVGL